MGSNWSVSVDLLVGNNQSLNFTSKDLKKTIEAYDSISTALSSGVGQLAGSSSNNIDKTFQIESLSKEIDPQSGKSSIKANINVTSDLDPELLSSFNLNPANLNDASGSLIKANIKFRNLESENSSCNSSHKTRTFVNQSCSTSFPFVSNSFEFNGGYSSIKDYELISLDMNKSSYGEMYSYMSQSTASNENLENSEYAQFSNSVESPADCKAVVYIIPFTDESQNTSFDSTTKSYTQTEDRTLDLIKFELDDAYYITSESNETRSTKIFKNDLSKSFKSTENSINETIRRRKSSSYSTSEREYIYGYKNRSAEPCVIPVLHLNTTDSETTDLMTHNLDQHIKKESIFTSKLIRNNNSSKNLCSKCSCQNEAKSAAELPLVLIENSSPTNSSYLDDKSALGFVDSTTRAESPEKSIFTSDTFTFYLEEGVGSVISSAYSIDCDKELKYNSNLYLIDSANANVQIVNSVPENHIVKDSLLNLDYLDEFVLKSGSLESVNENKNKEIQSTVLKKNSLSRGLVDEAYGSITSSCYALATSDYDNGLKKLDRNYFANNLPLLESKSCLNLSNPTADFMSFRKSVSQSSQVNIPCNRISDNSSLNNDLSLSKRSSLDSQTIPIEFDSPDNSTSKHENRNESSRPESSATIISVKIPKSEITQAHSIPNKFTFFDSSEQESLSKRTEYKSSLSDLKSESKYLSATELVDKAIKSITSSLLDDVEEYKRAKYLNSSIIECHAAGNSFKQVSKKQNFDESYENLFVRSNIDENEISFEKIENIKENLDIDQMIELEEVANVMFLLNNENGIN
jgi:hypothetical protein